jgi:tetratricopeptide (TPR) repeat protein
MRPRRTRRRFSETLLEYTQLDSDGLIEAAKQVTATNARLFGRSSRWSVNAMSNQVTFLRQADKLEEAVVVATSLLEAQRRRHRRRPMTPAQIQITIAVMLTKLGRYAEAERSLEDVLVILPTRFSRRTDVQERVNALLWLGDVRNKSDRTEEALIAFREAFDIAQRSLGENDEKTIEAKFWLAVGLTKAGEYRAAIPFYRGAVEGYGRSNGSGDPLTTLALWHFAQGLHLADENAEAVIVVDAAQRAIELQPGNHDSELTALAELQERIENSLRRNEPGA